MKNSNDLLKDVTAPELSDDDLEAVVGGFSEGEQVCFRSGRIHCTECDLRNITGAVYPGMSNVRLAHLRLPCGHETYAPQRAICSAE